MYPYQPDYPLRSVVQLKEGGPYWTVKWIGKARNQEGFMEYVYLLDDGNEMGYWERDLQQLGAVQRIARS